MKPHHHLNPPTPYPSLPLNATTTLTLHHKTLTIETNPQREGVLFFEPPLAAAFRRHRCLCHHWKLKLRPPDLMTLFDVEIQGRCDSKFAPYQVSPKFHPRVQDKKFIERLRKWTVSHQPETGTQSETASSDSLSLKEIKQGNQFNLTWRRLSQQVVMKSHNVSGPLQNRPSESAPTGHAIPTMPVGKI
ncbi:nucleic acid-binding, OB-fold-like protein [Artemisia annua]|uniref:Nucleic acid-binding, OB-fold-like protein n=1 Tax=Artemisia annua TaxID=35608 RepID=A0A2U1MPY8_ARTAN|nr:nucleic acid-binding, OB-fold-like protein [Artemisia annua]